MSWLSLFVGRFVNVVTAVVSMASHPFSDRVSGGLQITLFSVGTEDDYRV